MLNIIINSFLYLIKVKNFEEGNPFVQEIIDIGINVAKEISY